MDRRIKVLMAVHKLSVSNGGPPTYDEIAAAVGMTKGSSLSNAILKLEEAGLLEKRKGKKAARDLKVTSAGVGEIAIWLMTKGQRWVYFEKRCPACHAEVSMDKSGIFWCNSGDHARWNIYDGFWRVAKKRAEEAWYEIGGGE